MWLKYWIIDEMGVEQASGEFQNQAKNRALSILWDGSSSPLGIYKLRVRYSLFSSKISDKESESFQFYHLGPVQ